MTELVAPLGAGDSRSLRSPRVIAISNQKGGVGKTTTTANLGHALAERGLRVLLIDADPQANLTTLLGDPHHTIMLEDILARAEQGQSIELSGALQTSRAGGAHLIGNGGDGLAVLMLTMRRATLFRKIIAQIHDQYDVVLIDTARTKDILSLSAIVAATEVLVPLDCDPMALDGLEQIRKTLLESAEDGLIPGMPPTRVLLTKFEARTNIAKLVVNEVARRYGETLEDGFRVAVLATRVRVTVRAKEAYPLRETALTSYPDSTLAVDYRALAEEVVAA